MRPTPFPLRKTVQCCLLAFATLSEALAQTSPTALPTGGALVNGNASISQTGAAMRINQTSGQAIIDWTTFNIGKNASVQYLQPNSSASILNRVASGPSDIAGSLTSNGRVFLINPNGVLFSSGAQVNVGALVAGAGSVSNAAFLSGAPVISNSASVRNAGQIRTAAGGSVVLSGTNVRNDGTIDAPRGAITLAAGDTVRINLSSDGLLQAQVTGPAAQAIIDNAGVLDSEAGAVSLVASAAAGTAGGLVNQHGIIRATGLSHNGGVVTLTGGTLDLTGNIDVSAQGGDAGSVRAVADLQNGSVRFDGRIAARADGAGNGGMVETSGAHVKVADGASVDTLAAHGRAGSWLIDPQDFTIGPASGSDISASALSRNLESGNVTIDSRTGAGAGAGDVNVGAPISWAASTTLTLTAERQINFGSLVEVVDPRNPNASNVAGITATGATAGLALNAPLGFFLANSKVTMSGASPSLSINGTPYVVMNARSGPVLDTILRSNLNGNYALTDDIDASATRFADSGAGWLPIGTAATPFAGNLFGFGHTISGLTINRPTVDEVGLLGVLSGTVRDLGMVDPNITGNNYVGTLAGRITGSSVSANIAHSFVAGGSITGNAEVGAMAGASDKNSNVVSLSDSYVSGSALSALDATSNALGPLLGRAVGTIANVENSFYDLSTTQFNGKQDYVQGALLPGQFADWLNHTRSLHIADYSATLPFDSASGSYLVGGVQSLRDMLGFSATGQKFTLSADIDLANAPGLHIPYFTGELDGANHTVSNLLIDQFHSGDAGMVGDNFGTIRNLVVSNANVNGFYAGGVAGLNLGTLRHTSASGSVVGTNAGGLAGASYGGTVADSDTSANVSGRFQAGGLVGDFSAGALSNSHFDVDTVLVNDTHDLTVGGIYHAQYLDWQAHNRQLQIADYAATLPFDSGNAAYTVSSVAGMRDMLGFVDQSGTSFRLGANIDLASAPGLFIPVLYGRLDGAGHTVSNLTLNASNGQYLGLVGYNFGAISNIGVEKATVSGAHGIGGVAGINSFGATIDTSYASGAISATDGFGGGLAGYNYGTINNSMSSASVTGGTPSGGLVGYNYGNINNSYASGSVDVGGGGLVGTNSFPSGTINNSYWNTESSGRTTSDGGTGKTGAQLQQQASFTSWDFNTVWRMFEGSAAPMPRIFSAGLYTLTISANTLNTIYGDAPLAPSALGVSSSGLQGSDTLASLSGTLAFGGSWQSALNAGSYTIVPAGLTSAKYDLVFVDGALIIAKAALTVTADNKSKVYGAPDPLLTSSISGLKYSDTAAMVSGVTLATSTGAAAGAGTHVISIAGASGNPNYTITSMLPGTLTVAKATLTVTADDKLKVYGDADPLLTSSVSGLQYADTAALVSGVTLATSTGAAANAGTHPITISGASTSRANYTIGASVPGTLTVAKAALLVTADDKVMQFGAADPALTYSVSGLKYADSASVVSGVALSTSTGAAASVGGHPIVASGGSASNYSIADANGILIVAPGTVPEPPPAPPFAPPPIPPAQALELLAMIAPPLPPPPPVAATMAVLGPVVSTQRKALFSTANTAIANNPTIATLKDCDGDTQGDCIAKPRVAVKLEIGDELRAGGPALHIKRKVALVIGNNAYASPLSSLDGARDDAGALAKLLASQGYEVNSLFDAKRSEMIAGLNKLIRETRSDESVLVYYAGHGHIHPGSSVGYWIPVDATFDDPRGWLSNVDIARFLGNIPARQVLLVSDSCFSGALTREGGADENATTLGRNGILARRSVVAMSSGGEEVVADAGLEGHSPFTYYLLKQLQDNHGEVYAKNMLREVRDKVRKSAAQVPAYGTIVSSGHMTGGEYLFNPSAE